MQISEYSFSHLYQAEEERFTREFEQRRIALERAAEVASDHPDAVAPARHARSRRAHALARLMSHPGGTM